MTTSVKIGHFLRNVDNCLEMWTTCMILMTSSETLHYSLALLSLTPLEGRFGTILGKTRVFITNLGVLYESRVNPGFQLIHYKFPGLRSLGYIYIYIYLVWIPIVMSYMVLSPSCTMYVRKKGNQIPKKEAAPVPIKRSLQVFSDKKNQEPKRLERKTSVG